MNGYIHCDLCGMTWTPAVEQWFGASIHDVATTHARNTHQWKGHAVPSYMTVTRRSEAHGWYGIR